MIKSLLVAASVLVITTSVVSAQYWSGFNPVPYPFPFGQDQGWTMCTWHGTSKPCRLYSPGPSGAPWDICILKDGKKGRCLRGMTQ
jgi:hypothetical protein